MSGVLLRIEDHFHVYQREAVQICAKRLARHERGRHQDPDGLADQLYNDAWVHVQNNPAKFATTRIENPPAYLAEVMFKKWASAEKYRTRPVDNLDFDPSLHAGTSSVEDAVDDRQLLLLMNDVIASMPEREQIAFKLAIGEGRTHAQIAQVLNTGTSNARKITNRALETVGAGLKQIRAGTFCDQFRETAEAVEQHWPLSDERRVAFDRHIDHCISCRVYYGYLRRAAALLPMPVLAAVSDQSDSLTAPAVGVFAQLREALSSLWRSGAAHADTIAASGGGGAGAGAAAAAGGGGVTLATLCAGGGKVAAMCAAAVVAAGGAVGVNEVVKDDRPKKEKTAKSRQKVEQSRPNTARIASVVPSVPSVQPAAAATTTSAPRTDKDPAKPKPRREFDNLPERQQGGGGGAARHAASRAPSAAAEFSPEPGPTPSSSAASSSPAPSASATTASTKTSRGVSEFGGSSGGSSPKAPSASAEFGPEG